MALRCRRIAIAFVSTRLWVNGSDSTAKGTGLALAQVHAHSRHSRGLSSRATRWEQLVQLASSRILEFRVMVVMVWNFHGSQVLRMHELRSVALGFALCSAQVQILVQGPTSVASQDARSRGRRGGDSRNVSEVQLHGDTVQQPPKFIIPTSDGDDGVEVRATAWHEVQVQHALTDLGRPDGSTGGFYGLMRRTRFIKMEVLRRLFAEDDDATPRTGTQGDFREGTLTQPLHNALASLQSAPRPPGWRNGDDEDLHVLEADATTRTRMLLAYEKNELYRDIVFLEGRVTKREQHPPSPQAGNEPCGPAVEDLLVETMTIRDAKQRCHSLPGCRGFCFHGDVTDAPVKMHFRGCRHDTSAIGWTYFSFEPGEIALSSLLAEQHEAKFRRTGAMSKWSWVEDVIPAWDAPASSCYTSATSDGSTSRCGLAGSKQVATHHVSDPLLYLYLSSWECKARASESLLHHSFGILLTLDFQMNKKITEEVATIPSKRMRNKIAGFTTHLMKRIQRGPVRGISLKLQEEERERRMEYVPDRSEVDIELIQVDPDTRDMLKEMDMDKLPNITTSSLPLGGRR
ncbi:unnamed protein product [Polarella glacialis]|uniref:40S ribosomal protein S17 n=1 Tax=Polarella glacialis TaxID=89957 RepID=A0A813LH13_POLGL|nr:unnamed protein product [Polarella glacialis]